jgi:hypothetical protein
MIEAFRVGTTLTLTDLISPKLLALSKTLLKVELQVAAVDRQFKQIGKANGGIKQASNYTATLDKAVMKTDQHAKLLVKTFGKLSAFDGKAAAGAGALMKELDMSDGAAGRLTGHLAKITAFNPEMRLLAESTRALSTALRSSSSNAAMLAHQVKSIHAFGSLPSIPVIPGGGGHVPGAGGRGGGHGNGGNGMHGRMHVGPGGAGFSGVGMGVPGGVPVMAGMAAGYIAYAGVKSGAEAAGDYELQKRRFEMFGMSPTQNQNAFDYAAGLSVPGASNSDKMRYMIEAQGAFRESGLDGGEALRAAKMAVPMLAKIHFASILSGKELTEGQEMDMLRFAEQRGAIRNPKLFNETIENAYRTTVTSGGQVDFSNLRQFMRTSQGAGMTISDEALLGWGEPLLGELKGGPAGTALATARKRLMGITKATKTQLHTIQEMGAWDMSKVVLNAKGGVDHFTGDGIPLMHASEFGSNPFKWFADYVLPQYKAKGLDINQQGKLNADMFGGTGGAMFDKVAVQLPTILDGVNSRKIVPGIDVAVVKAQTTLTGQEQEFDAAWKDFKTAFGETVLPAVISTIRAGTEFFKVVNAGKFSNTNSAIDTAAVPDHKVVGPWGALTTYMPRWMPGSERDASVKRDAAVAPKGDGGMSVTVHAVMDGTPIHTKVTQTLVRKLNPSLGTGFFDPNVSPYTQYTTGN